MRVLGTTTFLAFFCSFADMLDENADMLWNFADIYLIFADKLKCKCLERKPSKKTL